MFTKRLAIIVFAILTLTACKDNKKETDNAAQVAPVIENFSVEFNIIAKKGDDFAVYYTEDNTNNFVGEKAVWGGIKGGGVEEKVTINLPSSINPTNIRLDFGIKPDREDVIVKSLKFVFFDQSFEIKGSDFLTYFVENPEFKTSTDVATGTTTIIRTPNFEKTGTYFYPKLALLEKIKGITKGK